MLYISRISSFFIEKIGLEGRQLIVDAEFHAEFIFGDYIFLVERFIQKELIFIVKMYLKKTEKPPLLTLIQETRNTPLRHPGVARQCSEWRQVSMRLDDPFGTEFSERLRQRHRRQKPTRRRYLWRKASLSILF